ncbi:hypothetical protein DCCM_2942 [Desulfocucumis palustris]|uniref:Uncharacterized protein n=1 Tax=Desulfocucumis palustris TaxID=1898651 RepID=A0A2L2XIT6_9FIRM|nr:hypothetical protein [Desulfocucumis palustris]GBF33831.1 hypothetical protein DCCM_2942 [Desulfocucumis palustris]
MNIIINFNLKKIMLFLVAMVVIFDFPPVVRQAQYCPAGNTVINIMVILFFYATAVYFFRTFQWSKQNILSCLFVGGYFIYRSVHTYYGQVQFYVTVFTMLLIFEFLLLDASNKVKVFHYFRKIMVVLLFFGILVYGMRMVLGTGLFEQVNFYSQNIAEHGYYYLRLCQFYILEGGYVSRLCGPFNEPGVVGTFAALLLIADQFDLRKKGNIVLLVAGVLSFSLAFFILCAGYIVLCAATERRKDFLVIILIVVILLVFLLPYLRSVSTVIDELAYRFTITGDGLAGDNRTDDVYEAFFSSYMQTADRWLGLGTGAKDSLTRGANLSYKTLIIEYGIIGFAYLSLGLLFLPMVGKWKNRRCIYFVLLFLASIYQRPNVMVLSYLVLLIGGTEYCFSRSVGLGSSRAGHTLAG